MRQIRPATAADAVLVLRFIHELAEYRSMGAQVLDDWRICRLAGDALRKYGA